MENAKQEGDLQFRQIFIQVQDTPNHNSLKFIPGVTILQNGTKEFKNYREACTSPLAKALFKIEGVSNVFFGRDFIAINKAADSEWNVLKPSIFEAFTDFFDSGQDILEEASVSSTTINEDDDEIVQEIKEILETRIRPAVQEDGGDISFVVRFCDQNFIS